MSACRYCSAEVVWVPTLEGARPFSQPETLSPEAPVVVMRRHDCAERKLMMTRSAEQFMQDLYRDPMIRTYALRVTCPDDRCGAPPDSPCWDLRPGTDRPNKNPHKDRMIAGARLAQEDVE